MRKREVVSYVLNCILILVIVVLLLHGDYDKKDNEYLQQRITDLEEDQISLNMQLAVRLMPELVEGEGSGLITKDERIEELELIVIAKSAVLIESYGLVEAMESHIIILKQVMDMNKVIYPEFVYIRID